MFDLKISALGGQRDNIIGKIFVLHIWILFWVLFLTPYLAPQDLQK